MHHAATTSRCSHLSKRIDLGREYEPIDDGIRFKWVFQAWAEWRPRSDIIINIGKIEWGRGEWENRGFTHEHLFEFASFDEDVYQDFRKRFAGDKSLRASLKQPVQ